MQSWRFPLLELTPGAVPDASEAVAGAGDAVADAATAASSLPPEILAAGGVAARTPRHY